MNTTRDGRASAGPVAPTAQALACVHPLGHSAVRLDPAGWLGQWQACNASATIPHVVQQVCRGEAWTNLARVAGLSDEPLRGMFFTDSDVYKVLEAIAWEAGRGEISGAVATAADSLVALLAKVQQDDGYLNSRVQGTPGLDAWADPQWGHELYTAGHLFQAAVAASRAGVLPELVDLAARFATLITSTHAEGGYVDGHPEVETAMVELYRETGDVQYLTFAAGQIERRGRRWLGEDRFGAQYYQDHVPVREATEATGHAVRQVYLLAGMVDVAVETRDLGLLVAAERLWEDLFHTKTYISGAHGSRHRDEALGDAYELPPDRAYAETCAAIGSFQLNWRLLLATGHSRYAEEMERALYNAVAVSTSLDGTRFFYSNPLQLRAGHDGTHEDSPDSRLSWYSCACCPPNVARLLASIHDYLVTSTDTGLVVQHYAAATVRTEVGGREVCIDIATEYPYDATVSLTVEADSTFPLHLRIPAWCRAWSVEVDGVPVAAPRADEGYLRVERAWAGRTEIVLRLEMPVEVVHPHPRIDAVRGCVAITRGPLVYSIEDASLPAGAGLEDLRVRAVLGPVASPWPELAPVAVALTMTRHDTAGLPLYRTRQPGSDAVEEELVHALPYHRWANRAPGAMRVWIPTDLPDGMVQ